ncbi:MAG TPA: succinate dehydrogenase cytochrome b subunit [Kofleriaceae bacterium]|nr:succinate dehydrogenase cytochrome b subunit [Kofleriaceae bacterium]
MSWFVGYVRSSIGAKQIMAVTGLGLLLFAIVHMVGHFGMFGGRDAYNTYAHTLQSLGALKWAARGGLLAILIIHVATAIALWRANAAARPQKYAVYRTRKTTIFARTMTMTGLVILAFIIYHLAHFTFGWVQPASFHTVDAKGRYDAYSMYVLGFQNLPILISYLVAVTLLSFHLAHGASSWLQSLGWRHPKYDPFFLKLGPVLGLALAAGYAAPPLAVFFKLITL